MIAEFSIDVCLDCSIDVSQIGDDGLNIQPFNAIISPGTHSPANHGLAV